MQAKTEEVVHLELPAVPASIKRARDAVAELADRLGAISADVKLAVSEAVTNAVVHGFRESGPGTITVDAGIRRGRLLVVIADDGAGMRPNPESNGLGLGMSLITSLSGDARFDSSTGGVTVSMTFGLGSPGEG